MVSQMPRRPLGAARAEVTSNVNTRGENIRLYTLQYANSISD